jgi:hypothetical protein
MRFKLTTWRRADGYYGVALNPEGTVSITTGPLPTRREAREALRERVQQVEGFRIVKRMERNRWVPSLGNGGHKLV